MSDDKKHFQPEISGAKDVDARLVWWAKSLSDIDVEIARMATLCNVRILDPGVIERVLKNDASVCGSSNPAAFAKLRTALIMHYGVRDKAVEALGEKDTRKLVEEIVAKLRERIGEGLGRPTS